MAHYELCVFFLEHYQNKLNKLNQCFKKQWYHVIPAPVYVHGKLVARKFQILRCRSYMTHGSRKDFLCIRLIKNWLCHSMLMDLLIYLPITAVHGNTILFQTNGYVQCLCEHPPLYADVL